MFTPVIVNEHVEVNLVITVIYSENSDFLDGFFKCNETGNAQRNLEDILSSA